MNRHAESPTRLKVTIRGAVQGVGFRPAVHSIATDLGLTGRVSNTSQGLVIEAEGSRGALDQLLLRVQAERPSLSSIQSVEASYLDPKGFADFSIGESTDDGPKTALVLPDIAACPECLREISDPANRRYGYPFTNCTHCGPRFSIIEALPYDRSRTSMRRFEMCSLCLTEYRDPRDRRFHAQPNACPRCGPHLEMWDSKGNLLTTQHSALEAAAAALRKGSIIAMKGLGGFHLLVDARNEFAVRRLRKRKHREEKPFALMFANLGDARSCCEISTLEHRLLSSPEAPIVLLRRIAASRCQSPAPEIAPAVAPGNPNLGVMLPYTPLHHLLMDQLRFPVVATSGNLSDEPICTDEQEAVARLGAIADLFLVHNRPIVRPVDDSVARIMGRREMLLRRSRGYAPLPIPLGKGATESSFLAVGAHQKCAVALSVRNQAFLSQHIGDLDTDQAVQTFRRATGDLQTLYETQPSLIVSDAHPDYVSTRFARETGLPVLEVQHHLAHVFSCMAENDVAPPLLGVSWDGTGYGLDGTVWGGEFFLVTEDAFQRVAHFRQFPLPGSDAAVREPRRAALGLLYEFFGSEAFQWTDLPTLQAFSEQERTVIERMLAHRLNAPLTSSVGRLFDVVASLIGLRQKTHFEGQAAMELEFAIEGSSTDKAYDFALRDSVGTPGGMALLRHSDIRAARQRSPIKKPVQNPAVRLTIVDYSTMIRGVIDDVRNGIHKSDISRKFHNTLVEIVLATARKCGQSRVALSGGCFQNKFLSERIVHRLDEEGFHPYQHQRVPPNDGGIALGQIYAAIRNLGKMARRTGNTAK